MNDTHHSFYKKNEKNNSPEQTISSSKTTPVKGNEIKPNSNITTQLSSSPPSSVALSNIQALLRNYLRFALSTILYNRQILDSKEKEGSFAKRNFVGLQNLHWLEAVDDAGNITNDHGYKISQWLEQGVFPEIQKQSLLEEDGELVSNFIIVVVSKSNHNDNKEGGSPSSSLLSYQEESLQYHFRDFGSAAITAATILEQFEFQICYPHETKENTKKEADEEKEKENNVDYQYEQMYANTNISSSCYSSSSLMSTQTQERKRVSTLLPPLSKQIQYTLLSLKSYCQDSSLSSFLPVSPSYSLSNNNSQKDIFLKKDMIDTNKPSSSRSISFVLEYSSNNPTSSSLLSSSSSSQQQRKNNNNTIARNLQETQQESPTYFTTKSRVDPLNECQARKYNRQLRQQEQQQHKEDGKFYDGKYGSYSSSQLSSLYQQQELNSQLHQPSQSSTRILTQPPIPSLSEMEEVADEIMTPLDDPKQTISSLSSIRYKLGSFATPFFSVSVSCKRQHFDTSSSCMGTDYVSSTERMLFGTKHMESSPLSAKEKGEDGIIPPCEEKVIRSVKKQEVFTSSSFANNGKVPKQAEKTKYKDEFDSPPPPQDVNKSSNHCVGRGKGDIFRRHLCPLKPPTPPSSQSSFMSTIRPRRKRKRRVSRINQPLSPSPPLPPEKDTSMLKQSPSFSPSTKRLRKAPSTILLQPRPPPLTPKPPSSDNRKSPGCSISEAPTLLISCPTATTPLGSTSGLPSSPFSCAKRLSYTPQSRPPPFTPKRPLPKQKSPDSGISEAPTLLIPDCCPGNASGGDDVNTTPKRMETIMFGLSNM